MHCYRNKSKLIQRIINIMQQLYSACDTKFFTKLEAESLHETTNIVKHYHQRLRYHQTKTSTQTSANLEEGNGSL